jgi:hypothetical protein
MFRKPHISAALLASAALVGPSLAQVVTPPINRPDRAPAVTPQPPTPRPQTQARPARAQAPDVDFVPITEHNEDGKVVMLGVPAEYLALAHNPMIDLPTLVKIAPGFYERRQKVERLVTDHVDLLLEIEDGLIEQVRVADETALRDSAGRLQVFTGNPTVSPSLTGDLVTSGRLRPDMGALTQQILQQHQQELTTDAMSTPTTSDGATPIDMMMHRVLRLSIGEFEYYFRRLMLDTADYFGTIMPELGLDSGTAAAVKPLAAKLANESDIEARAALIREIFSHLSTEQRRRALGMAIDMRPEIDPTGLMAPVPAGATPIQLDDETRRDLIFQLIEGGQVDTNAFVE